MSLPQPVFSGLHGWLVGILRGPVPTRVVMLAALIMALAALAGVAPYWFDPYAIDDDARMHLLGFVAQQSPEYFRDRFLAGFALRYLPHGYRVLMGTASTVVDPLTASRALGTVLIVATWAAMWGAGRRIAGTAGGGLALLLTAHSGFITQHTYGGLYRGFGFVFSAALIWALSARSYVWASTCALGMALFYPPAALIGFPALGLVLLLDSARRAARPRASSSAPKPTGNLVLGGSAFALAAALAVVSLMTFADKPDSWGELVDARAMASMGEFQAEGGRLKILPLPGLASDIIATPGRALDGLPGGPMPPRDRLAFTDEARALALAFAVLTVVPGTVLLRPFPVWWWALASASVALYATAEHTLMDLGYPDRYVKFTGVLLIIVAFPMAVAAAEHCAAATRSVWRASLAASIVAALLTTPLVPGDIRRDAESAHEQAGLMRALRGLPAPVLVAGMPGGAIENIPVLAHREVLVDYEHALPLYTKYYAEVRRRTEDVLRLLYAHDVASVVDVRDRYGLTHVVLSADWNRPSADPPSLYRPLGSTARQLAEAVAWEARVLADPPPDWIAWSDDRYVLVDLGTITSGATSEVPRPVRPTWMPRGRRGP